MFIPCRWKNITLISALLKHTLTNNPNSKDSQTRNSKEANNSKP